MWASALAVLAFWASPAAADSFGRKEGAAVALRDAAAPPAVACGKPPALLNISGRAVDVELRDTDYDPRSKDAGSLARLEGVVQKLVRGQPVHIVVFGGSVSGGSGCAFNMTRRDEGGREIYAPAFCAEQHLAVVTKAMLAKLPGGMFEGAACPCGWPKALVLWLRRAFPTNARVRLTNRAAGGRGIAHLARTLSQERAVLASADLVLLEFALNNVGSANATARHNEEVVRHLLHLPRHPAVVFLEFAFVKACREVVGSSAADAAVARYYRVPLLDFHAMAFAKYKEASALARNMQHPRGGAACSEHHPKAVIHHQMANAVARLLVRAWQALCARKWVAAPWPAAPLMLQPAFSPAASGAPQVFVSSARDGAGAFTTACAGVAPGTLGSCGGWSLCEDRPGKPGWISTEPGSHIAFHVRGCAERLVIGYMRSYRGMGRVRAYFSLCAPGDGCAEPEHGAISIDAFKPDQHVSVYDEAVIRRTDHPHWCPVGAGGKPAARWLHFVMDKLSPRERHERGGSKFKLLLLSGY